MPAHHHEETLALVVKPSAAMLMLSVSRTRLYELLNAKELESFKDGGSRKITLTSIRAYVQRKLEASREAA